MTKEAAEEIQLLREEWDWEKFRREVIKFVMTAIISNWGHGFAGKCSDIPKQAIELADELIKQLKENDK